jgi:hypothetical protein
MTGFSITGRSVTRFGAVEGQRGHPVVDLDDEGVTFHRAA